MDQNSVIPVLLPIPASLKVGTEGASDGVNSTPVEKGPTDADGNYEADLAEFSLGRNVGTVAAQQQVISGPPLPSRSLSRRAAQTQTSCSILARFPSKVIQSGPRCQSGNDELVQLNTNVVGNGYVQKITTSITNDKTSFSTNNIKSPF